MATLVLQTVGAAVGAAIAGPFGAIAGRALGGLAGASVDRALLGGGGENRAVEGPRLLDMPSLASTEGAPIPRVYGRARIGGELIWATRFEEIATTTVERSRNSGAKGAPRAPKTFRTTYTYASNLAVGLCEGPIAFVRRVWADGREIDQGKFIMRLHRGDEDQPADPLIVAKEGADSAPAYRGLAYVVFERLPLEEFGNRIPQFAFEVVRPVEGLGSMIRAVELIPGATEFGYDPTYTAQMPSAGVTLPENRHQLWRGTDIAASLDALQALCPRLERVALVVSWFGDDLRAGQCTVSPRVESHDKNTPGMAWSAAGLDRLSARLVSRVDGRPAYGGTPSDASVIRLIAELKARGIAVVLYPFLMMDIAGDNALPNPHTGTAGQPPYPWRGRVTCDPAPGRTGTVDGTAAAAAQVAALFGQAARGDFSIVDGTVAYAGPAEWTLRRQVLHCAHLALAAGGVDGFIIGSEMIALTRVRGAAGYPAVDRLVALAAEARAVLGSATKLTYAADWTEYGAHVRDNGATLGFPLDPLWASPAIDAVGIDFYPPLSDWRDGTSHADVLAGRSVHDRDYLVDRVAAGEAHDWFYASDADRRAQVRSPIADGAHGKPWVYRAKDLAGWWGNAHIERAAGVETVATAWVARSKPIWLTEIGIPAVDKGTNAPNVFPDPKSSESEVPYFSSGLRDDLIQARGLEAILTRFDPAQGGHQAAWNPVSPIYGGRMVDPGHVFVWCWDARPFPAFPDLADVWSDGANWETGHWLNGRIDGVPLDRLVAAILADHEVPPAASLALDGFVDGYVVDRPMAARDALEPLARLYGFEAVAGAGTLRFQPRGGRAVATLTANDLVPGRDGEMVRLRRAQDSELPREVRIGFTDGDGDYRRAAAASRRLVGASRRETGTDVAVVTRRAEAQRLADIWLQDLWVARETAEFSLSPRRVALEAGDIVALQAGGDERLYRLTRLVDGADRRAEARAVEPTVYDIPPASFERRRAAAPRLPGQPHALVLDLAVATAEAAPLQYIAIFADPWPGRVAIWRAGESGVFDVHAFAEIPAIVGETLGTMPAGPLWRWDDGATLEVRLAGGGLASVDDSAALAGRNTLALRGADGAWEIVTAARAELVGTGTWRLSRFVRGLAGSEAMAGRGVPAGAAVVVLDDAVLPLASRLDDLGRPWRYRIGPADRDHADPSFVEIAATPGPLALKPLAPVGIKARRIAAGVALGLIRRTRRGGDAWEPLEVPLGEDAERYEIDILAGATVVRTLTAAAPLLVYAAADEAADFGAPQATLSIVAAQVSTVAGRGFETRLTVPVR